jgi:hypothetical protein
MQHVIQFIEDNRMVYEDHPLLRWLKAESQDQPDSEERRLWPALFATYFIMAFSGLNRYHIRYTGPGDDPERETLNRHALEDMTHSRLYLRDFATLGWARHLPPSASGVLRWMLSDPLTRPIREGTIDLCTTLASAREPRIRFSAVEAIEAVGGMQFSAYTIAGKRWAEESGRQLVYFGDYHLGLETGRTIGDEGAFDDVTLTEAERKDAFTAVLRVYRILEALHDTELTLAQEAISRGGLGPHQHGDDLPRQEAASPALLPALTDTERIHVSQHPILAALEQARDAVPNSPGYDILATASDSQSLGLLRVALLLWAPGILGESDIIGRALPYQAPAGAAQRAISRLAARITPDPAVLYEDWAALQLDERLAWSAQDVLEFIWLDPATEPSRDLQATLIGALACDNPLLRYWTALAWAHLTATRRQPAALLAARHPDLRLPYLSGSRPRSQDVPTFREDPLADSVDFTALPADDETVGQAVTTVDALAGALQRQLAALADCVTEHRFPGLEIP